MAAVLEMAGTRSDWEFPRLHGMGEALYGEVVEPDKPPEGRPPGRVFRGAVPGLRPGRQP